MIEHLVKFISKTVGLRTSSTEAIIISIATTKTKEGMFMVSAKKLVINTTKDLFIISSLFLIDLFNFALAYNQGVW